MFRGFYCGYDIYFGDCCELSSREENVPYMEKIIKPFGGRIVEALYDGGDFILDFPSQELAEAWEKSTFGEEDTREEVWTNYQKGIQEGEFLSAEQVLREYHPEYCLEAQF